MSSIDYDIKKFDKIFTYITISELILFLCQSNYYVCYVFLQIL